MRNPKNSWDKSDSYICTKGDCKYCKYEEEDECYKQSLEYMEPYYVIGANDMDLAKRLVRSGSDHSKFMRQIFITVDITAPFYWWKEFDTYKIATVANSCSTMHTITDKPFTREDFSLDHTFDFTLIDTTITYLNEWRAKYIALDKALKDKVNPLPKCQREEYKRRKKAYWYQIIQALPTSYNQKRTVTLNYQVVRNIYFGRYGHKLDEWSEDVIAWVENLPYSELITE